MTETKLAAITWHLCDKPDGYLYEDCFDPYGRFWHKGDPFYDLPPEEGPCLVTYVDGEVGIEEYAEGSFDGYAPGDEIVAWAELPKGGKREDPQNA